MWTRIAIASLIIAGSASAAAPRADEPPLSVRDLGAGRPVVLIPGLAASAYSYRNVTPALAGYRCVIVEPLGYGLSPRPAEADYSLTAQSRRIAREMDSRGLRDAVIVAEGTPVSVALRLAIERPDLVAGIVAVDGGPAESAATPGLRKALKFAPLMKLFGGSSRIRKEVEKSLRAASGDDRWITEDVIRNYAAGPARDLDATLDALRGMSEAREPAPLSPRLVSVACPVELLVGGAPHEGGISAGEIRLLGERLPDVRVRVVAGAGHFIHEERPQEVVDAVLRMDALAANVSGSPDDRKPQADGSGR